MCSFACPRTVWQKEATRAAVYDHTRLIYWQVPVAEFSTGAHSSRGVHVPLDAMRSTLHAVAQRLPRSPA